MQEELTALARNQTWTLVPSPPNIDVIGSRWVFKVKQRADGSLERYKARLVAQGFNQRTGIDCGDTYSPVVKPATIRTVLTYALSKNWHIHQLDLKNAFLHSFLTETVFMKQPPGFISATHPDYVCKLNRALYALK